MDEKPVKTAVSYEWGDLEVEHPAELASRRRIVGGRMMVSRFVLEPGFHMDPHTHHNEQISIVLEGRLRFAIGEGDGHREEELVGGQVLSIPPCRAARCHRAGAHHRARSLQPAQREDRDR